MGTGKRLEPMGRTRVRPFLRVTLVAAGTAALAGCSDSLPSLPKLTDLNPFAEKQTPLPGKRVPIMAEGNKIGGDLAAADKPIVAAVHGLVVGRHRVVVIDPDGDALPVRGGAQQVSGVELGFAEEDPGALLVEVDDLAQNHADGL